MLERGVAVSYESIRRLCLKFGPIYAAEIRRRRPQPRDKWHLDEVFIKMGGRTSYLWRAVDADGLVLDTLVQGRRNQEAAEACLRRLVEAYPAEPRVVVTDKLATYGPAMQAVLPRAEHRKHKGLNNHAAISHQPTRQRGERCGGVRRLPTRSGAWSRSGRSGSTSARAGIADRGMIIVLSWPLVSRYGGT